VVGGAAAAVILLVAGVVVGVTLSGQHARTGGAAPGVSAGSAAPSSASAAAPPPAEVANMGTATLVGQLTAPGGALMNWGMFSADGNYVDAASPKGHTYVFSAGSMKLVRKFYVAGAQVSPVSFSPDDKTLYTLATFSNGTNEMLAQDIGTGKTLSHFDLPAGAKQMLLSTNDGSVIDSVAADGTVTEYEMASGKVLATVKNPGSAPVANVWPDADGRYVIISDTSGKAYYVDALTGHLIATFSYPYPTGAPGYPWPSRDGNTVRIPGGTTAPSRLWDLATKSYITPKDSRWPTPDGWVGFSEDSKYGATSATAVAETVDIWDIETHSHVITLTVPGLSDEYVIDIGPGASELLTSAGLNTSTGDFGKLDIWSIPG
jgi:WD40 repeat protein